MTIIKNTKLILLLAIVAAAMSFIRFGLTGYDSYMWLNWNLFLALVPIFFAWLATRAHKKSFAFAAIILWLGFLPNAPYLLTDFIHLADVGPRSYLWYDGAMIFMFTLTGMASWVFSFDLLKKHFNWKPWAVWFIALLTAFGVYLGRYLRFNSWDAITKPLELLETIGDIIIHPLQHNPMLMMVTTFTGILVVLYTISTNVMNHEKTKN